MSQKPLDQARISHILGSTTEPVEADVVGQVLRHKGDPPECWVLRRPDGGLLPPLDDDGTKVFMAWPSRRQAERGLKHQIKMGYLEAATVERLFPGAS